MPSLSALGKFVTRACARLVMLCLRILGAIFSSLTLAAVFGAAVLGAIFVIYGQGLPSHDEWASYQPKTISRIYSGEGHIIDEFAVERRLFASADEIPDLVKAAFISAEDKNFFKPLEKKPKMLENLRSIFYKMELAEKEIRILSSVFASLAKKG